MVRFSAHPLLLVGGGRKIVGHSMLCYMDELEKWVPQVVALLDQFEPTFQSVEWNDLPNHTTSPTAGGTTVLNVSVPMEDQAAA